MPACGPAVTTRLWPRSARPPGGIRPPSIAPSRGSRRSSRRRRRRARPTSAAPACTRSGCAPTWRWPICSRRVVSARTQFLMRVRDTQLSLLRASAARLREQVERGARRGADLQAMLRMLLDLGQVREAAAALDRRASEIDPQEGARLRAEIALRGGDYARACEFLMPLGASRTLAFAAARAGDYALAARTLEALVKSGAEPGLRVSLDRVYRDMVVADLMAGRRRLVGETQ